MDALRERAAQGESLDELLPECFAIVRETGKRTMGMRHFDVQLIGAMALHDGCIAEMKTGEGKTLTATLAVVLNSLAVRDRDPDDPDAEPPAQGRARGHRQRLPGAPRRRMDEPDLRRARRDRGGAAEQQPYEEKQRAYACDVVYGTNSEFGFDYLRDNMAKDLAEKVQRGHSFAIVDEVDNILIDEARTPLIISGAPEQAADLYVKFARLAPQMTAGQDARRHGPAHEEAVHGGLRLRVRREAQDGLDHRAGRRQGRALPRHRPSLPGRERPPRQPPDPGAAGRVAVQARRRLRGDRRRGEDHRRVHRAHPRGPALVGGAAPGDRGQGGRADPGGEPDARDDHLPELLPPLRQARGHDRHGADRGDRVHEDLRAAGRADPDEHADGPRRSQRSGLQDQGRQVERGRQRDRRAPRERPAGARGDDLGRGLRAAVRAPDASAASSTRC